jgi:hypothetical protein
MGMGMIKNSIMIIMIVLLIGCVKSTHEDTELGAMEQFWNVLGSGDTEYLESLKKKKEYEKE